MPAWGIGEDRRKVLLHLMAGLKEGTETVRPSPSTRARGLADLLIFVPGRAPGTTRAIEEGFPRSTRLRGLAHRIRNLAMKVPVNLWPEFEACVTVSFQAPSSSTIRDPAQGG